MSLIRCLRCAASRSIRFWLSVLVIPVTAAAQTPENGSSPSVVAGNIEGRPAEIIVAIDTLSILVGEGVIGRVDTLDIRVGAIGPNQAKTFTLTRSRGTKLTYTFRADSGFENLVVVADEDSAASRGSVILQGNTKLLVVAARRVADRLIDEATKRAVDPVNRRALICIDDVLGGKALSGCARDRLIYKKPAR